MGLKGIDFRREVLLVAIAAIAMSTFPLRADYVSLRDGRMLEGEVIEEHGTHILFRHNIAGIWITETIQRVEIDALDRLHGDQSDGKHAKAVATPNEGSPAQGDVSEETNSAQVRVAVIPLHGAVGGTRGQSLRETFDAAMIEQCLVSAEKSGATVVILDIDSPGGLVSEMEAICQTIIRWHGRMRIVAFPRDALSAAAIITLCCREMGVRPDSRVGAAVIIQNGEAGPSAVDAKMASPHHAMQKLFMAASGRPYEVVSAMTIQETQLWWSPQRGFVTTAPKSEPGVDWIQVDGATTILTMSASDAVRWGLAVGECVTERALLSRLGIKEDVQIVRMNGEVEKYLESLDRRLKDLIKQSTSYFNALGGLADSLNELREAYSKRDREAANRMKADIKKQISRLQNAGRAIAKIDRSLLARRVDVPEEVIEQMKADAAVLGRINSLLISDTVEGFNESADRLNAVIASWRKLLGLQ